MPGNKKNHRKRIQMEKRRAERKPSVRNIGTIAHVHLSRVGAEMAMMSAFALMMPLKRRRTR